MNLALQTAVIRHTWRVLHSQWWSTARIAAWQEHALVTALRYACTHVPFYRNLKIAASEIRNVADLQRFPIVRKQDLQTAPQDFLADGTQTGNLNFSRTSGSTGEPTVTWFDHDTWALCKYALKIRRIVAVAQPFFRRCLIVSEQRPDETLAYGSKRPFGAGFLYAERLVSLFEDMAVHRQVIESFRPDMLYAFPSYLQELAGSYQAAGTNIPHIPYLFTSSEALTAAARNAIANAFRGQIFDLYGCTEFKEVAWECSHHRKHVNFESTYVEAGTSASATAPILLTSLTNRAMPLIRYHTGDLGSLEQHTCACGRQTAQLQIALGREGDMIPLPDGQRLSPYLLTTSIENLTGLQQYRLLHTQPKELVIELLLRGTPDTRELESCRLALQQILHNSIVVKFIQVTDFARRGSGKHKVYERQWS
jgi:phenylacetate-CoA ligase